MSKRSHEFAKIQPFDQAMRKLVALPKDAVRDLAQPVASVDKKDLPKEAQRRKRRKKER